MGQEFVQISLTPIVIACLVSVLCALPGNFLILRGKALLGDAISHSVLPGIVLAFLVVGEIAPQSSLIGAIISASLGVMLIAAIRYTGIVEPGAAIGLTFTTLFALGVILLESSDTSQVHLDVEHALYGNLENLIWLAGGDGWVSLLDRAALAELPRQIPVLALGVVVMALFVVLLWRPLVITSFDPSYARTLGIASTALDFALLLLVTVAVVLAFDAVGSIVTIAMLICPAAAARLVTTRLAGQVRVSIVIAITAGGGGYVAAGYGPIWLGGQHAVSAAGMIAVLGGVAIAVAAFVARRRMLS